MTGTIHKFPLGGAERQRVPLPPGAKPLSVGFQGGNLYLWAAVPREPPRGIGDYRPDEVAISTLDVFIALTGGDLPEDVAASWRCLGRAETGPHQAPFVVHVFVPEAG